MLEANPRLGDRLDDLSAIAEGYAERKRRWRRSTSPTCSSSRPGWSRSTPVRRRLAEVHRWVLVDELHD